MGPEQPLSESGPEDVFKEGQTPVRRPVRQGIGTYGREIMLRRSKLTRLITDWIWEVTKEKPTWHHTSLASVGRGKIRGGKYWG